MPDLLLELFSEEIPARMQAGAARDLERLVVGALTDRGLLFEGIKAFAGPRRLTLAVAGLPAKQRDVREELKGPKVDAPPAAIEGFLKKTGLTREQLKVETTPKGDVYLAVIERAGRDTAAVLAEVLPEAFAKLPWPKSMRWKPNDPVRWVRPLHSILCTFDGEVVPFSFAGIASGNVTRGHRFLSQGEITVRRYDDYAEALHKAHVMIDADQRKAKIFEDVKSAAFVHGLELIADEGLLNEVAGLAEWPVVLTGLIEQQFMDVPAEILQTSMRTHQKYFALRDPKTGKMANRFALVANMIAEDGGKEIVAGNERVLRARLFDAKFFWDEDRKHTLKGRIGDLIGMTFHAKLGSQFQRSVRIAIVAGRLCKLLGRENEADAAREASMLCKADLTSGVVGEFPELQGIMGGYYAANDGHSRSVVSAIAQHYRPVGPNDSVPETGVAAYVAVADKIDLVVSLFYAGEVPSGSSDPFALRRAALGAIRIILTYGLRVKLHDLIAPSLILLSAEKAIRTEEGIEQRVAALSAVADAAEGETISQLAGRLKGLQTSANVDELKKSSSVILPQVIKFFIDRLKVALKEKGTRHDLIDAVFSLGHEDDLVRLVARVEALQAFLKSEDGATLLAGYKRAANILKVEEKKDAKTYVSEVDEKLLAEPAEKALFAGLTKAQAAIAPALEKEDFAAAMRQMASLRTPVDAFFEAVKVNADDPKLRENRLHLLASLRAALHKIADFSRIEG